MQITSPPLLKPLLREEIMPRLEEAGFVDPKWYRGKHMGIVREGAVKSFEDETAIYAHFIDSREAGQSMVCRVWIAPWHQPDDSLERLQVGVLFTVYDEWEWSESVAAGIASRILAIDRMSESLRGYAREDLKNPAIETKRSRIYRVERRIVELVRCDLSLSPEWQRLMQLVSELPEREFTYATIEALVESFESERREAIRGLLNSNQLSYPSSEYGSALVTEAFHSELSRRTIAFESSRA